MATSPSVAVLDYGMGNLRSVARAWEHAGAAVKVVSSPAELTGVDALVFPGQGALPDCMVRLAETGFDGALRRWIDADRPFFGICLGLQALFERSEEGETPGLGLFPGEVIRFRRPTSVKIPHMGWNAVKWVRREGPDAGLSPDSDQFYFVHSFHVVTPQRDLVWGETGYAGDFTSAISRGRCFATQFHPEKSQAKGLQLYRNFLERL